MIKLHGVNPATTKIWPRQFCWRKG